MSTDHVEGDLDKELEAYAAQLRQQMGLEETREVHHFHNPTERPFTKSERDKVTVLYGGLTLAHEQLVKGALEGLGYIVDHLPCPDNESLNYGKEYGNRGQCNPTYYTVGNLVKFLLQERGRGVEDVEDKYVFVTAGACGPCRFGMYEAEYRKALRDAGFPDFRVLLFQQAGGLDQVAEEAGLNMNAAFFIGLLKGILVGDLINELGYKIRPYEVKAGETNAAIEKGKEIMYETLKERKPVWRALRRVKRLFDAIECDYTRVKPRVKITGEFWAQTTEGDGSYRMPTWLEEEGAEVHVEPIGTWIEYLMWTGKAHAKDRRGLHDAKGLSGEEWWKVWLKVEIGKILFDLHHLVYRAALGFRVDRLPNMNTMAKYADEYYNTRLSGGEGHMEVGKNIMAVRHKKAHMVVSLKPFGCMPSTQSDGVQSKVVSDHPEAIFIPIETSGDGEIGVKSRVQMKLFEAKMKAREEFAKVLASHHMTVDEVKATVAKSRRLRNAMRKPPHVVVGTAANFVSGLTPWRMRSGSHMLKAALARGQALLTLL